VFATLIYTGMRIGEALGLRWSDVRLATRRITVQDRTRRLKTASAARLLPIPEPLALLLAEHAARVPGSPTDLVFPPSLGDSRQVYRIFLRSCARGGITGATVHDLRHTFAVHAVRNGVPIARLQKLLGHTTPVMTMRNLGHAPESYLDADAQRVAESLTGVLDKEQDARAALARGSLKRA
jgi:integrase